MPITVTGAGKIVIVVTVLPVALINIEEGVHTYELAPDAVIVTFCPGHTETGGTVTTGKGLTVTVTCAVAVHPLLLPVTV